ncbi:MAG: hypothetical protein AB8H86_26035 [Polyangiales bacterium]
MSKFSTDLQRCFFCVVASCVVLAGCGEKFVVGDEDAATDGGAGNDARTDSEGDACDLATAEYRRACEFGERTYENICRGAAEGFVRYEGLCVAEVASLDACLEMKACGDFPCEEEATAWATCLDEACSCREDCHPGCEPQPFMFVLPPVALSDLTSLAFADGLCTSAAGDASLGGTWVAYLGSESNALSERVPSATYHRTSDRQPAFSFSPGFPTRIQSFLFDAHGAAVEPIMAEASGGLVSGEIVPAWSGTPSHCSSWTSSSVADQASLIELEGTLLNLGMFVVPCDARDFEAHLLCLEVL